MHYTSSGYIFLLQGSLPDSTIIYVCLTLSNFPYFTDSFHCSCCFLQEVPCMARLLSFTLYKLTCNLTMFFINIICFYSSWSLSIPLIQLSTAIHYIFSWLISFFIFSPFNQVFYSSFGYIHILAYWNCSGVSSDPLLYIKLIN